MRTDATQRRTDTRRGQLLVAAGLAAVLGGAVVIGGCGAGNPHPIGTYERAVFYSERGKHLEAVTAFENYVRRNPTDSLAAAAQFGKAMTYLELEEYPLAAVEFQILRKDYPTSDLVEDALFQEGVAYFKQVGRLERDITGAYEARLHFLEFAQEYPGSPHMPEVVATMQEISDLMVRKRLSQIRVFRQLGRHQAVAVTLDDVLLDEAASTLIPEVLWERAKTAKKLDDFVQARAIYERLVAEHPESDFAGRARRELADIGEPADNEQES